MKKREKWLGVFCLGAVAYPALEILYRRRTHASMALCGGLGLVLIRLFAQRGTRRLKGALLSALGIVLCEYCVGRACNRNYTIWDYRSLPGNIRGQVCPQYFALWYLLALALNRK